jgi:protein ImuA
MPASGFMAENGLTRLRRRIAEIEGRPATAGDPVSARPALAADATALSLGIARLDRLLAGGLRRNALHEIRGETGRDAAAATGFATAILARLAHSDRRPLLWIVEAAAARETGLPYGVGLGRFGLDPRRLVIVRARKPEDALWVFEEGLRCHGLAAVLAEIHGAPRLLDLTASRRLALRAGASGVTGLLLRHGARPEPGAAMTRWLVTPQPATTMDDYPAGIGHPAWRLTLERNRAGATGIFDLEWDHDGRVFAVAGPDGPAFSRPVAAPAPDRPPLPPTVGPLVALRRAS